MAENEQTPDSRTPDPDFDKSWKGKLWATRGRLMIPARALVVTYYAIAPVGGLIAAAGGIAMLHKSCGDAPSGSASTYDNHGTNDGIIGPNGTQTFHGPRCPAAPSDTALAALKATISKRGITDRFTLEVAQGTEHQCKEVAAAVGNALIASGWVLDQPGIAIRADAPEPGGMVIVAGAGHPGASLLHEWADSVGLANRLELYPQGGPSVTITVGNLPSRPAGQ